MGNAFGKLLHEADRWKKKINLAVLCIQEHNLKPSQEGEIRAQAVLWGYSFAISFGKTDNPAMLRCSLGWAWNGDKSVSREHMADARVHDSVEAAARMACFLALPSPPLPEVDAQKLTSIDKSQR